MSATGITLDERVSAEEQATARIEHRQRVFGIRQRRVERVQRANDARLQRIEERLGRLHLTMVSGLFTILAALVGGLFDLLAHLHP